MSKARCVPTPPLFCWWAAHDESRRGLCKLDSMTECTGSQGSASFNWHGTLCYALLCACLVMASAFVVIELLHATEPEPYFNPPSRLPDNSNPRATAELPTGSYTLTH